MEKHLLEKYEMIIEEMSALYINGDVEFFIADKTQYLYGKGLLGQPVHFQIGAHFSEDGIIPKIIALGKPYSTLVDAKYFGIPFKTTIIPIFDNGVAVGAWGMSTYITNATNLKTISREYAENMTQIAITISNIAQESTNIALHEKDLCDKLTEIHQLVKEIEEVSKQVASIAGTTNLLGLNASIEAARATGEQGRTFNVIAEQIRKLSDDSKKTAKITQQLTERISVDLAIALSNSQKSLSSTEDQSAATEEIAASIEELTAGAEEIDKIASDILNH